ncbi:uroporphyrinogen-III C-methyltransferase [Pseudoalteromonas mariniglutinosa]|uniref:uroporphyrinogen-III C-methyltransferase n=1 Tax=Pseudoalteromonas mariniglutinosa TaxID=206042 RepID=UPI003850C449
MHILITRPEGKGAALAQQLQQAGYQATMSAVLELNNLTPSGSELAPLQNADKVIFISQDAVHALHRLHPEINKAAQFYAVGQQTADAIYDTFGIRAAVPKQHDSEGLLALKSLQDIAQNTIVIVKGLGGRTTLAKELKQRGAFLNKVVVYERLPTSDDPAKRIDHWQRIAVSGIVITSNAAVDAIFRGISATQSAWLIQSQFYVASERIAAYLQQQHVAPANIHIAAGASDSAMFACIKQQGHDMSGQSEVKSNPATTAANKQNKPINAAPLDSTKHKKPISKTGSLALLISVLVAAAMGYQFYHKLQGEQQTVINMSELQTRNQSLQQQLEVVKEAQQTLQQALYNSEQKVAAAISENAAQTEQQLQFALQRAEQQVYRLNPQEVTSLQRMAEFKLWAEKDYQGAIAVLTRLDSLLSEHAGTAAIRQAIHQDLQTLKTVQLVPIEALYLQIHGVSKQVDELIFNAVSLPEEVADENLNALSDDLSEWQQNLIKSWQQFKDDFIKIRSREEFVIAPLLSEQERHLITQRLNLYLAQAQDALLSEQASVYYTAIDAAKKTVDEYFKHDDAITKGVLKSLAELSQEQLNFAPEINLKSTEQVQEWAQ